MFYRNSCVDTDQMPHCAASELDLHYLPITLLGVSQLKWVKSRKQTGNHKVVSPIKMGNLSGVSSSKMDLYKC